MWMILNRIKKYVVFFVVMGLTGLLYRPATAQSFATSEYEIKAAFLFNFAKFAEWPPETMQDTDGSFVIGILGKDPFKDALEQTIGDKTVRGSSIQIRRFRRLENLQPCHILFISESEMGILPAILRRIADQSILTVSDMPGFASHGGMINLYTENNKVRFMIHTQAVERAGLILSAKLLNLAKIFSE